MRRLTPEQRRQVEEWLRVGNERCSLCGSGDLRCDEYASIYLAGGLALHLRCTNSDAEAHAGGIGQTWTHSITSGEARSIGIS